MAVKYAPTIGKEVAKLAAGLAMSMAADQAIKGISRKRGGGMRLLGRH